MHQKILFTLSLCILATFTALGQKAKFKNKVCVAQKAVLPTHYVEPEQRTYDFGVKGLYSYDVSDNEGKLYGWTRDEENPHFRGVLSLYGFRLGRAQKKSKKREKKNKEGKVTSSWTDYTYENTAKGLATLYVYGQGNAFDSKKYDEKKDDAKKAAQEKKRKELEDNPFLTGDIIDEAEESEVGEDEGLADTELPLLKSFNVDQSKSVKSGTFRKATEARKDYNKKAEGLYDFKREYQAVAFKDGVSTFNRLLGYKPVNDRFWLKRMKSDKHPEFKKWNDACEATVTIFKTFKFNKSIEDKKKSFEPIVDYFADQLASLSPKDKKVKKHRKAALTNLLAILDRLDRHDDVIMYAEKYMSDKKLDGIAKRHKRTAEMRRDKLAFHKMESRHIDSAADIDEGEIEESELLEAEEEN